MKGGWTGIDGDFFNREWTRIYANGRDEEGPGWMGWREGGLVDRFGLLGEAGVAVHSRAAKDRSSPRAAAPR